MLLSAVRSYAQSDTIAAKQQETILREVLVKDAWANDKTPMTFKNLATKVLKANDFAQDMPYLLQQTPSVVASSDAGNGVGYSGIRIRGTDPTRINVTINGIPYNDSESQGVYWVNINDILSSTENIQIQRGVGTSTNGAGAFGATINLNTNQLHEKAYGEAIATIGSFGTQRRTVKWGSGTLKSGLNFEGRWSHAQSDGYIDRAASDLKSQEIGATWLLKRASLRFNIIAGNEKTYQAWYGVPFQYIRSNRTYNPAGTERLGSPYDNQVDNYFQKHFQLFYNQQITQKWSSSLALHLTRGFGYYEEYKAAQSFSKYTLPNVKIGDSTITETDLVRRRWLDNWFYGSVFGLKYEGEKVNFTFGGGYNEYKGKHFGEIIWGQTLPAIAQNDYRWYDNDAFKRDFNTYSKINYAINDAFSLYVDMQYRHLGYNFIGKDRNGKDLSQTARFNFFNPKLGATFQINPKSNIYLSYAKAHREPNRNDFVNSTIDSRPKAESLDNVELGFKNKTAKLNYGANLYFMKYKDELVLTGKINDVGEFTRINVPSSHRIGIEMEGSYHWDKLNLAGNLTLSQNKIKSYTEYIDNWDTGTQIAKAHNNTNIAFSPNAIASTNVAYSFLKYKKIVCSAEWLTKYVGKQFLDNANDELATLPAYFQNDVRLRFSLLNGKYGTVDLALQVNNLFNANIINNGWVYRYASGVDYSSYDAYTTKSNIANQYAQIGYYPQAFRNYAITLRLNFE